MRKPGFQLGLGRLLWPVVLAVLGFGAAAPALAQGGTTLLGVSACMLLNAEPMTDLPPPQMDQLSPVGEFHPGDIITFTLAQAPTPETTATKFSWVILTGFQDDPQTDPVQRVAVSDSMGTLTYKVPAGAPTNVGYRLDGDYGDVVMTVSCQPPPPPVCSKINFTMPIEPWTEAQVLGLIYATVVPGDVFNFTLTGNGDVPATSISWDLLTYDFAQNGYDPWLAEAISLAADTTAIPPGTFAYTAETAGVLPLGLRLLDRTPAESTASLTVTCTPAPIVATTVAPVSTLSEWSLILMGLLAVGLGIRQMRRLQ